MSTVPNQHNFRFPSYADSPDVPKDISYLAKDIADYIDANPGPQGDPGPANVLTVQATNTIDPGQNASVTITGTSPSQSLTFNIPRGQDGIIGGPGPSTTITIGTVTAGVDENDYDATMTGTSPSQVLNLVLPRGLQGIQGPQGIPGPTTVAVGTTTTGAAGTNASVTNTGTNTNAVFAFTIPRGATGATGPQGPAGADGANASLDPIATTISLNPVPNTFTYGVTSDWYPLVSNTYNIGIPAATGVTARYWKTIYSNTGTIQTSDQRFKKDIESSNLGLDFINNLNPVSYKFIEGSKEIVDGEYVSIPGSRTHYGLIAQEVKEVLDQAGIEDFGGWVKLDLSDEDSDQALRYEEFISPLIKAVQELTARVQALEAR
jgi:hypothetical protein